MTIDEIIAKLENKLREKADDLFYETSVFNLINKLNVVALGLGPYSQELAEAVSQTIFFLNDTRRICDRILLEKSKAAKLEAERKQHGKLETDVGKDGKAMIVFTSEELEIIFDEIRETVSYTDDKLSVYKSIKEKIAKELDIEL